ncbi:MAG: isoaspartyl peptidase/L-asparaginase [Deltaproteobacteria bacterium]|jgi:beta-aspartyl-peptidase (threonine type)|nr:isoaspartyl peptidase/L-asparaginase [Deltaproteobacteria bacterium]
MEMIRKLSALLNLGLAISMLALPAEANICDGNEAFTLLLHGGLLDYEEEVEPRHRALFRQLLESGRERLAKGGSALDVVVESIAAMEDSGILNAGKGSIVNSAGFTETDASLMDGRNGRSGAVAAMQRLKNPILASRLVMERTKHVLFAGATGEQTLADLGAELVEDPASYFQEYVPPPKGEPSKTEHGTVGAVALDRCGNLAAGTSTGGWPHKMPGRVGDTPIIGASTYADQRYALSTTGVGESFIKRAASRDIAMRAEYLNTPLKRATDYVVKELIGKQDGAGGAIIAIGKDGEIVVSSNSYGVLYGWVTQSGDIVLGTREP